MLADIFTIVWKEWNELFLKRGTRSSSLFSIVIMLGMIGIFIPTQYGADWFTNPLMPIAGSWLPIFLVLGVITDSIAGERERHTLETLLASRLSDQAILFGKIATSVLYAWGMAFVGLLIGAVTINVTQEFETIQFYDLQIFGTALLFIFLAGVFFSTIGVLVSLKSPTARQAYQRVSIGLFVLVFLPSISTQFLPEDMLLSISKFMMGLDVQNLLLYAGSALLVLDVGLLTAARLQFERAKLILSS